MRSDSRTRASVRLRRGLGVLLLTASTGLVLFLGPAAAQGGGGGGQFQPGAAGGRRSVLPAGRERRLRRRSLRPRRQVRPGDRRARGNREDPRQGDAEPVELQPRPARPHRAQRQGGRTARGLEPRRPGAHDHAEERHPQEPQVHGGRPLQRHSRADRGSRLHPHGRRGSRHRRAARRLDLVSGQRPPERQGVLLVRGHRAGRARGRRQRRPRGTSGRRTAGRPGRGRRRSRWPRT